MTETKGLRTQSSDPIVGGLLAAVQRTDAKLEGDVFAASVPNQYWKAGAIYGGILVGQALAAMRDAGVPNEAECISTQAQYHAPGDENAPYIIQVERTRDTRSFFSRSCSVKQGKALLLTAVATFQMPVAPDPSFLDIRKQAVIMPAVPAPEELKSMTELSVPFMSAAFMPRAAREGIFRRYLDGAWDVRPTTGVHYLATPPDPSPRRQFWSRMGRSGGEAERQRWFVGGGAFGSQCALVAVPEGYYHGVASNALGHRNIFNSQMRAVSLDFCANFHRPFSFNDWLLLDIEGTVWDHGRAHTRTSVWDRKGNLVATITQELLMRVKVKVETGVFDAQGRPIKAKL